MSSKNSSGDSYGKGRTRNYASIIYLDSAPFNWKEILQEQFIPAFISPLHDMDINPDGETKKPHHHVMIMFDSTKTAAQAQDVFSLIGGVGLEIVQSQRGYARYLCHLDNPEKAQYLQSDVISLCGADYSSVISLVTDKYKALSEMQDFCVKYDVFSFFLLCEYAKKYRLDWYRILCDNGSFYMREFLKSKLWSKDNNQNHIFDPDTGEILI